jgi:lipopolysaccharide/colanic/teichoic acid biosynthesis glycosyltransferase
MIILSPLYIVLWLLAYCSSKGPAFYSQQRIGLHGKPFLIYKFRTMVQDAEDEVPQLSADDDPRVTRVGKFMRRYRLDELPQMWNVLKGDMSIVGPRPERAYFIRLIEEKAPYYCLLYKIRPGLTSWGPIKVGYTDTVDKMVSRLNYDIAYMENMSLLLDIKIMLYTIAVVFGGKGK